MSEYPRARVIEVDGQLVLEDPDAVAMIDAIGKYNCKSTLELHAGRIMHFRNRVKELGRTADDSVIVVVNGSDPQGLVLAEVFGMPDGWEEPFLAKGETPYARGIQVREPVQELLENYNKPAADQLKDAKGLCVLVFDYSTVAVFELPGES